MSMQEIYKAPVPRNGCGFNFDPTSKPMKHGNPNRRLPKELGVFLARSLVRLGHEFGMRCHVARDCRFMKQARRITRMSQSCMTRD